MFQVVDKVLPGVKMDSKGENLLILMALMKVYFGELIEEGNTIIIKNLYVFFLAKIV